MAPGTKCLYILVSGAFRCSSALCSFVSFVLYIVHNVHLEICYLLREFIIIWSVERTTMLHLSLFVYDLLYRKLIEYFSYMKCVYVCSTLLWALDLRASQCQTVSNVFLTWKSGWKDISIWYIAVYRTETGAPYGLVLKLALWLSTLISAICGPRFIKIWL